MVLPEDSNNVLVDVLQQIADSLDKNTDILNRICNHYDSVVPVMKKNQEMVALSNEDNRSALDKMYDGIFRTNES
tara:strand:+ start:288 stop:512 length:225 start_codon:yes stop_codon:yes gene_type:complete